MWQPMRCMEREIFDLPLSIPHHTPGQRRVGQAVRMGRTPAYPGLLTNRRETRRTEGAI
jgi:hypothetical protein